MKFKKSSGQILLEILISVALFTFLAFSVAPALRDITNVLVGDIKRQRAVYLGREGLEAVRAIAEADFSKLREGNHGLNISNWSWEFLGKSDRESDFIRQINIKDQKAFEELKRASVRIEWEEALFKNQNFSILYQYFVNPEIFAIELNLNSYLMGQPIPWQALSYTILLSVKPGEIIQEEGATLFGSQDISQVVEFTQFLQIEIDGAANYQIRIGENTFLIGPVSNRWSQLAVTWNGLNLKTFYNGQKTTSQILSPEKGNIAFKNYLLGISGDRRKSFKGVYKNLMIFERALSSKEVSDLFSGRRPSLEGLKLYWRMEKGEGSLVKDFGPFNVFGNITGQPVWREILNLFSWEKVADF